MARIPAGEQFGQVVSRPGPMANINPDAYGAGVGRSMEQVGNTGMQIAGQEIAQANAEAQRLAQEQEREAKQAAAEARRTKAAVASATAKNDLKMLGIELERDLDAGKIAADDLQNLWTERSAKLIETAGSGLDDAHKPLFNASILDDVGNGQIALEKIILNRNRKDILASGVSMQEQLQRSAASGPKEADKAIEDFRTFWMKTSASAGEDKATATIRVQQFAEKVRLQQATGLVNVDPAAALKALKNPEYLPELDPQQRTSLIHTADARVTQAAQRAEIQAQAYERKLKSQWEIIRPVFEAGKVLDATSAASAEKMFRGTPYEALYRQFQSGSPQAAGFAAQSIDRQRQILDAMRQEQTMSPDRLKEFRRYESAHEAALNDRNKDPWAAYSERGGKVTASTLTLDMKTLPQQLALRAEDARQVSTWAGQEVSLLRPHEAEWAANVLQAMPPKDRAGALAGISKVMTPGQMRAFGKQLGAKDNTLAAAAISLSNNAKTTNGRYVSEIALTGADAMKEKRVKLPREEVVIRAEIDAATRGAYLSEDAQRAAGDFAMATYAGLVTEGQSTDVGHAVRLATGGVMDVNGSKIIKPYGWEDSRVLKTLREFNAPKVEAIAGGKPLMVGGKPVSADEISKHIPNAQLGPSPKSGYYTVTIGGRMVSGEDGRPFLLPLDGGAK